MTFDDEVREFLEREGLELQIAPMGRELRAKLVARSTRKHVASDYGTTLASATAAAINNLARKRRG